MSNFDNNPYAVNNATDDYGHNNQTPVHVPDYFVASIVVTILCCLPFGIAGIVFASKAKTLKAAGQYQEALAQANKAKIFVYLSIGLGLVAVIANIALQIAATQVGQ